MTLHQCTEKRRIERIEKFLDGNGREGLNNRVSKITEKLDNLDKSVNSLKSLLRWSLGVIISVITLALSAITLLS